MFERFKKPKEEKKKEKIIKELQAKKNALEKLESEQKKIREDMIKMGKLALKDGKLQNVDDDSSAVPQEETKSNPFSDMPQTPQPQQAPQSMPQPQQSQSQMQSMPQPQPQGYMPGMMQQQMAPPRVPQLVYVILSLTNGENMRVGVAEHDIQRFIEDINNAISDCTSLQIGKQFISGRHILFYSLE